MPFYDENGNIVANGEHTRGDGAGILTFSTLSELQAALPNGSHSPVWVSSEKTWYHWNPSSVADTTAPNNITGLAVSNFAYNALTLSWTASNSLDVAGYRVYNGSTLIGSPTSSPFNVTGLNPQTAYTFFVKAIDSSNNLSSGVNVDATTPATPADTTPPANVASVSTSNLAETSVTLTWTASSSGDVSGYDIYNGSTFITTVTVLTYNVTGLTASTQYTFWVKARDAAGNVATGTSTTFTTSAVADTTAPDPVSGLTAGTPTANSVPLSWTLSSSGDVSVQEAAYSTDGTNFTVASAVVNAASNTHTVVGLTASIAYTFRVVAIDGAGNRSIAVTTTATTAADTTVPNLQLYLNSADLVGTTMPTGSDLAQGVVWPDRSGKSRTVTITRQWNWATTDWSNYTTSTGLVLTEINGSTLPNFAELSSGVFTWEFCVQMDAASTADYTFFISETNPWFRHKQATTGALNYQTGTGNYYLDQDLSARLSDGAKHHVMFIADGTNVKVYVDNVQVHTHAATSAGQGWTNVKVVFGGNGGIYTNKMTVVRYYDKALSSAERTTNYNECMA